MILVPNKNLFEALLNDDEDDLFGSFDFHSIDKKVTHTQSEYLLLILIFLRSITIVRRRYRQINILQINILQYTKNYYFHVVTSIVILFEVLLKSNTFNFWSIYVNAKKLHSWHLHRYQTFFEIGWEMWLIPFVQKTLSMLIKKKKIWGIHFHSPSIVLQNGRPMSNNWQWVLVWKNDIICSIVY